MKKIALLGAVLAIMSTTAEAQSPRNGLYGEVGYGFTSVDTDGLSFGPHMLRGLIGLNVHPHVDVEALLGFGVIDDDSHGVSADLSHVAGLYVKPKYALTPQFEVFGRVGFASTKVKFSVDRYSENESGGDFSFGVGARYQFNPRLFGTVDYMNYYDKRGVEVSGFTVGVGMPF